MKDLNLTLIRGLPGSGKTYLAREYARLGYVHYESDDFFWHAGTYTFDVSRLPEADNLCFERTQYALAKERNVVVANPFARRAELKPYLDLGMRRGAFVSVITLTTQFDTRQDRPLAYLEGLKRRWQP